MADALNEISAAPSKGYIKAYTPSPPRSAPSCDQYQPGSLGNVPERSSSIRALKTRTDLASQDRTISPVFETNYPSAPERQPPLDVQYAGLNLEEMDWAPSQLTSSHRAFNTTHQPKDAQFFGQTPMVPRPSPFWYKVPPAPITPAQRLRNPPNQPRLRVSSPEVKENFFNNVTRRSPTSEEAPENGTYERNDRKKQGIEFAQQKFFPPAPPSEAGNTLADLLTGFSLSSEPEVPKTMTNKDKARHFCQGLALFFALVFWNQVLNRPSEHTKSVTLAVMFACAMVGARTILDNTIYAMADKQKDIRLSLGACFGGVECAAAVYGFLEILAGRGSCENCGSLGTILVGGMMVHEIWLASFG